jgi:hypothetical protein
MSNIIRISQKAIKNAGTVFIRPAHCGFASLTGGNADLIFLKAAWSNDEVWHTVVFLFNELSRSKGQVIVPAYFNKKPGSNSSANPRL